MGSSHRLNLRPAVVVQILKPGRAADRRPRLGHHGARAAGLRTAFVTRPEQAQNPLAPADMSGPLTEVADTILAG